MKKLLLLPLLFLVACDKTYILPTNPTPIEKTPVVPAKDTIEYRVTGNHSTVKIRQRDPVDGVTELITTLPYSVIVNSSATTAFVSLEATPINAAVSVTSPFLVAQIYVNGSIFREASSTDFFSTVTAIGTYRR